jgi:hypothetical protein
MYTNKIFNLIHQVNVETVLRIYIIEFSPCLYTNKDYNVNLLNVNLLIYKGCWIGFVCRFAKKKSIEQWNCWIWCFEFLKVSLRELSINCVRKFNRFVRILEDQWKCYKGITFFNVQPNRVLYKPKDFFSPGQWDWWIRFEFIF